MSTLAIICLSYFGCVAISNICKTYIKIHGKKKKKIAAQPLEEEKE